MASWNDVEKDAPDLAERVRARFTSAKHHTLATLRRDGAPRISGTEIVFNLGEAWLGSMSGARKAQDLQRDPRFALHSASADPPGWDGDAKVAGRAEEITDEHRVRELNGEAAADGPSHLFRLDLTEASTVRFDEAAKLLIIEVWTPQRGVRRIERE